MKKISKVIIMLILVLSITGCGKEKGYGLNEEVTITSNAGEYSVKIIEMEREDTAFTLTYELKNISVSGVLEKDSWNFNAYDDKNNVLKNRLNFGSCKASKGLTAQCKVSYTLESPKNYVKLTFVDDYLSGENLEKFILEW